mgnify:FL=1
MSTKVLTTFLVVFFSLIAVLPSLAQHNWNTIDPKGIISCDTIKKGKNTLIFINKEAEFNAAVKQQLIEVFFKVYPRQIKLYNSNAVRKVVFIIDPAYKGVAAAGGGIVRFSPEWLKRNPKDIDVVTHEVMHLVQSYPDRAGPGWITEGIADYVRFVFGVDNQAASWTLPKYSARQSYTDSYRVTARFFYWLEKNGYKGLVKSLDNAMRTKTYTEGFWQANTGKSVKELWAAYSEKPDIT